MVELTVSNIMFIPVFLCNSNHYLATLEISWLSVFLAFYLTVNYILNNPAGWMILNLVFLYVIFFFFFFFFLSLWFGAFGSVGWWAVCMLCCSVPSWSAFRLTTSKVAFSYYLVFPARALSFLFVPVFSCVSWLASCSSIHLTQMPLILMLGMPFYCLIIIYWLYLNVRCFSNCTF